MAKSFSQVLLELARENPKIVGVSCDCWGFIAPLAAEFPDRAIELGIAEQNLIGVAAGLALVGNIPFAVGMNPFVTMRCFEQIRTDVGYGKRNVKVIGGYGSGLAFGGWGTTHHAIEEIALMRLIPGMTVIMPADAVDTERAALAAAEHVGPVYISIAGGTLPLQQPEEQRQFEIGKAATLREGKDVTVIATGSAVSDALRAGELLAEQDISARILNMHTVKPIDCDAVLAAAQETEAIITIEEHTVIGGLGGAVSEVCASAGVGLVKRLGLQDVFCTTVGSHADVKRRYGITAESVVQAVAELRNAEL